MNRAWGLTVGVGGRLIDCGSWERGKGEKLEKL